MKAPKLWQVQDCAFAICDVPAVFPHVYVGCISVSPCQWIVKFEKALGCSKFHMQHGDSLLMISTVYIISSDDFWCHCFHANWCRILSINISHIVKINRSLKAYRIMYIYITYHTIFMYSIVITIERNTLSPSMQHSVISIGVITQFHSPPLFSSRRCDANCATKSSTVQRATEQRAVSK